MALVNCPSCGKRVSSKAKDCPHCQFVFAGNSKEDIEREAARLRQEKSDKLVSQSMLALVLSIAAFVYLFFQQPLANSWQRSTALLVIGIGLVWFVINRVRLIMLKRKR
ncbi:MAG: hypothetical protein VYD08_02185 [Pseudomonadota bacterium]|nr:hypothetical protein [Pseudomonadota bacterium]